MKCQTDLEVIANDGMHLQPSGSFVTGIGSVSERYNVRIQVSYNGENCNRIIDLIGKPKGSVFHIEIEGQARVKEALDNLLSYCPSFALKEKTRNCV